MSKARQFLDDIYEAKKLSISTAKNVEKYYEALRANLNAITDDLNRVKNLTPEMEELGDLVGELSGDLKKLFMRKGIRVVPAMEKAIKSEG